MNMLKALSSLVILGALEGPALAGVLPAPAPEVGGGVLGLMLAAGVVYLIHRRGRSST